MKSKKIASFLIAIISVLFVTFHLYTAAFGVFIAQLQRSLHLTFAMVLGFLIYPATKKGKISLLDWILAILSSVCFSYIVYNYKEISLRLSMVSHLSSIDLVMGGLVILLLLELTRRVVGWALMIVALISLIYAFVGPYLPMIIAHRGFSIIDLIDYQCFGLNGIYSIPLGISATYIVLFIILGTFMEYTGVGDFIMDLGKSLAGRSRGGPAKIAVLTSALFGSMSGSAAANVYATGSITIPMMKKLGYKSYIAGAVEAVASTGGQIMPPVMGAAAFLMADLLGIPYLKVCKAALIPAILYFASLMVVLDFEAAKAGIKGLKKEEVPSLRKVISSIYLLTPLLVLIIVLMRGYTPFRAAFVSILVTFAVSFLRKDTRFSLRTFLEALVVSARRTIMIAVSCATAGIVIGVITLTGVGLSFSSIVISLSSGKMFIGLILIMISSIIMGMGTPTTVAYIIVVTLAAPAMKAFGFATLPSHLFVFYFGVLSMITPPVAIAAFAAAEIAKDNAMKIGFAATRIGIIAFIVPFLFLFEPTLLMKGNIWEICIRLVVSLLGVIILAGAISGWFVYPIKRGMRIILLMASLLILFPKYEITLFGIVLTVIFVFFILREKVSKVLAVK